MINNNEPRFGTFLKGIFSSWLSGISGSLAVPFTVLGVYLNNPPAKLLLNVLAGLALVVAAYQVWCKERNGLTAALRALKDLQDKEPRPQLFLNEAFHKTPYDEPGFKVLNRGTASAVNITGSPIIFGDLVVTAGVQSGVVHEGEEAPLVFLVAMKENPDNSNGMWNTKSFVNEISGQMEAQIVEREFRLTYRNTDRRTFMTIYNMHVDSIAGSVSMTYKEFVRFPVDNT